MERWKRNDKIAYIFVRSLLSVEQLVSRVSFRQFAGSFARQRLKLRYFEFFFSTSFLIPFEATDVCLSVIYLNLIIRSIQLNFFAKNYNIPRCKDKKKRRGGGKLAASRGERSNSNSTFSRQVCLHYHPCIYIQENSLD